MSLIKVERGYHWSREEDARLREAFANGVTSRSLAVEFGRTPEAIRKRAERLGVSSGYIDSVVKEHGIGAYRRGCRCDECRSAVRESRQRTLQRKGRRL